MVILGKTLSRRCRVLLLLGIMLILTTGSVSAEIYKYKTKDGKWAYTDKKPQAAVKSQTIHYKHKTREKQKPQVKRVSRNGLRQVLVSNPYHAPLEVMLVASGNRVLVHQVVAAKSDESLLESKGRIEEFEFYWALGDPRLHPNTQIYHWPVRSKLDHKITQAFHGRFSHNQQPQLYAVDIALPIGTDLVAARDGIVVSADDDYIWSGTNKYFLDKANNLLVYHDDGTFADYAHLLQGTITVKPGDRVRAVQVIGRSGTSGFSTGPHLHFVIRRNTGMDFKSLPFQFKLADGSLFTPKAGITIQSRN